MYARAGHDPATKTSNKQVLTREDFNGVQLVFLNILNFKQLYTLQTAFLKAKQHSTMSADFDKMTLKEFELWSTMALKSFLAVRQISAEGSFKELASR